MSLEENLQEARIEIARIQCAALDRNVAIPPPPEMPDPRTCCGRGCNPCMFTYYFDALEAWRMKALPLL